MGANQRTGGRPWWFLVAGFAASNVVDSLVGIAAVVVVVQRTRSATLVSAATAARVAPLVLLGAVVIAVAYLPKPRLVLAMSGAVRCLLAVSLAVASDLDRLPVVPFIAISAFVELAGAPYRPAGGALIAESVPEDRLARASAVYSSVEFGSFLVAPAVCGGLLILTSPATAFLAAAGLSALLTVSPLWMVGAPSVTPRGRRLSRVLDGARLVLAVRDARVLIAVRTSARLAFGVLAVIIALLPLHLDLPAAELAFFHVALAAGGIVAAVLLRKRVGSVPSAPAVVTAVVVLAAAIAAVGAVDSRPLVLGLLMVAGAADLSLHLISSITLQRTLPPASSAGASAAADSLTAAGLLVGSLLAPGLVSVDGDRLDVAAYAAAGALGLMLVCVLPGLLAVTSRTDARRLRSVDRVAGLSSSATLQSASAATVERLAESAEEVSVRRGMLVIGEGEPATSVFVLLSGRLAVHVAGSEASRTGKMPTLLPGTLFGEVGVLHSRPRTASVVALADSSLLRLPGAAFIAALAEDTGAGDAVSRQLGESLGRSHA